MANVAFQIIKEDEVQTNPNVTTEGYISLTERSIYLGLGNNKKVLYDGISPNNFLLSRIVDTLPTTANENDIYIDKTNNKIVIWKTDKFVDLSGSGSGGGTGDTIINLNGHEYVAGTNITIEDGAAGEKIINADLTGFTGFNVVSNIPSESELQNMPNQSLLFIL